MSTRIHGVDLARGLAILGMMFVHFASFSPAETIMEGYPSTLFAVVAGISLAIMFSRTSTPSPLLIRGSIILVLGMVLSTVPVIAQALTSLAVIYLLLFWVPALRTRSLLILFGGLAVLSEVLAQLTFSASPYPAATWLAYGVAGILLYRVIVQAPSRLWWVLLGSVVVAVPLIWWRSMFPSIDPTFSSDPVRYSTEYVPMDNALMWSSGFFPTPHSGTLGDIFYTGSVAVAIIAACVLLCRLGAAVSVTLPVRAVGKMALTVYITHVITAGFYLNHAMYQSMPDYDVPAEAPVEPTFEEYQEAVAAASSWEEFYDAESEFYDDPAGYPEYEDEETDIYWWGFAISAVLALILAPLWFRFFRRGPLEWVVAKFIKTADSSARTP